MLGKERPEIGSIPISRSTFRPCKSGARVSIRAQPLEIWFDAVELAKSSGSTMTGLGPVARGTQSCVTAAVGLDPGGLLCVELFAIRQAGGCG